MLQRRCQTMCTNAYLIDLSLKPIREKTLESQTQENFKVLVCRTSYLVKFKTGVWALAYFSLLYKNFEKLTVLRKPFERETPKGKYKSFDTETIDTYFDRRSRVEKLAVNRIMYFNAIAFAKSCDSEQFCPARQFYKTI